MRSVLLIKILVILGTTTLISSLPHGRHRENRKERRLREKEQMCRSFLDQLANDEDNADETFIEVEELPADKHNAPPSLENTSVDAKIEEEKKTLPLGGLQIFPPGFKAQNNNE